MSTAETTCWTIIQGAAAGSAANRDEFARRYEPAIRAYFAARWSASARRVEIDESVQDVFVECFRAGGALERVEAGRSGGFRSFLFGVVRHVARRVEGQRAAERSKAGEPIPSDLEASETSLPRVFDRAWATALIREAAARFDERARTAGEDAVRRVEILRLRFREGLSIR